MQLKKWLVGFVVCITVLSISTPAFAASYQIQPKDSLWKISQVQQKPLSAIMAANPTINPMDLQAGHTIELPDTIINGNKNTYLVAQGDTFWKISKKLNVTISSLTQANSHINPYNLYPGLELKLPDWREIVVADTKKSYVVFNGKSKSFQKIIVAKATAYSAAPEENGWGPIDYFGNPLQVGTIAVDPALIPLKSSLFVTGYSFDGLPVNGMIAHATDTGSKIIGNHIDIFVPFSHQKASEFGFQQVRIYTLTN